LRGSVLRKLRELLIDDRFELGRCVSWPGERLDGEKRRPRIRVLVGADALRALQLVDQLLVQPARFAAGEDLRSDLELGVAGREGRRRKPRDVDPRKLDPSVTVIRRSPASGGVVNPGAGRSGPRASDPKYLRTSLRALAGSKSPAMTRVALLGR